MSFLLLIVTLLITMIFTVQSSNETLMVYHGHMDFFNLIWTKIIQQMSWVL